MYLNKLYDGSGQEHRLDAEKLGDLTLLQTEARDTLVSAVNEVDSRVPKVTGEQNDAFLRVVDGALAAVQLTDVSKEGA